LDTGLGATDGSADALPLRCVAWPWRESSHPVTDQALLRAAASASRLPLHCPLRSTFLRVKAPRLRRPRPSAPPGTSASATTSSALPCPGRAAGHTATGRPARTHPHRRRPRAHRRMPPSRNRHAHGCEDHAPGTPHRRTCCHASPATSTRHP
jgi:hypothetical protein